MIKKLKRIILFIILTIFILIFITNPSLIMNSVSNSTNILFNTLLPSLLPFFILSDILINYNYLYYLNKIFKFKYFNIIILTMLSGLPSNAKYVKEMLNNNEISKNDAQLLLSFTFFPSPMFVIGTVGYSILKSTNLGFKILIIIYFSNLLFYTLKYKQLDDFKKNKLNYGVNIFELLKTSILKNCETLLVIFGIINFFNIIINAISNYLSLNNNLIYILNLFLEITSGVNNVIYLSVNNNLLLVLITTSLTFSGLCVIIQALTILNDCSLNFKNIIKNKLIISLISLILSIILF